MVKGALVTADELAALMECSADPNPFYGPDMLPAALTALDPDDRVTLLSVRDAGGTLIAALPVIAAHRHGHFPVAHSVNWMHDHCFYGGPLLAAGHEADGWRGLLRALDDARSSGAFLHLRTMDAHGPAVRALAIVCAEQARPMRHVAGYQRAMLQSPLCSAEYWAQTVRAKKRKELRRLQARLADHGTVSHERLMPGHDAPGWIEDFLTLEARGWKGAGGTALRDKASNAAFFRAACINAHRGGRLHMLRITVDGQPIAMLANFLAGKGAFSFKIASQPDFARYSPGVLIEIDNLAHVLDDHVADWMDSCAAPDHPMIDGLWAERRTIGQYRIGLRKPGLTGTAAFHYERIITAAERGMARLKGKSG